MSVLYGGVNHSLAGNGGPACLSFISPTQRLLESLLLIPIGLAAVRAGWRRLALSQTLGGGGAARDVATRRAMLALVAAVFGAEMGFKMASRTLIYLLNPCHLSTAAQLFILTTDSPHWLVTLVFRVHMYTLSGATLALAFPVLNTRLMPCEVVIYYLQHCIILAIPFYLIYVEGPTTPEPLLDFAWPLFSCGLLLLYHMLPLQILGILTQVNLNNIICPAVSDPFGGPYWRLISVAHQILFIPAHTKLYYALAILVSRICRRLNVQAQRPVTNGVYCNGAAHSVKDD